MKTFLCIDQHGFTLIELVVAVLIIGVLAGIAMPRLASAWDDAKESACKSNMKQIEAALELYYFENNKYPNALSTNDEIQLKLKSLPSCPESKQEYVYTLKNDGYELKCAKHNFIITDIIEDLDSSDS